MLPALALLAATGCASPGNQTWFDQRQAAISRGLADVVEVTDGAFGEPRVLDRKRIALAKIGAAVTMRENEDTAWSAPLLLHLPLPALARRTNISIEVDSVGASLKEAGVAAPALDGNKTVTAALIARVTNTSHAGVKLDLFWDEGSQAGVRPFLRWEWRKEALRIFAEQQVYERTNTGLGEKTLLQFDWVLKREAFVRLLTSIEGNQNDPGWNYEHALIYRRLFPRQLLVLSAELGARHNPYSGDPEDQTPGADNDTDEGYLQVRATGKVYRPWLEYEVTPMAHYPWHHNDRLDFGITFALRFVYESFLHGPKGGPAAVPSPQPNTGW